jgi:methanogenic corrinoid protein MtbC1
MSASMRHLLGSFLRLYGHRPARARLLFTTPAGERHEVGILGAAMLAASQGMAVSYLGPDLPARAIVEAVKRSGAHVLVLGLTLEGDGTPRQRELGFVLQHLPRHIEVWVGGPGAASYTHVLGSRGDTLDFDSYLRQLSRLSGGR